MKKNLVILCLILSVFVSINAKDYLTVYNEGFALVRTQFEINLEKGIQNYLYDDIPLQIETNSLIFSSKSKDVELFSQNFEYDLAGTEAILNKYINNKIKIQLNNNSEISGTLQYHDHLSIGIQDSFTKELSIINKNQVERIQLNQLPQNFYTKPTLNLYLKALKKGTYPIDISYISNGFSWFVTYNAVLNNNQLQISPWVTLNNTSGKSFSDVNLKLMAGEVKKLSNYQEGDRTRAKIMMSEMAVNDNSPSFTEKEFSDFRLYTLDQSVSINNNQTKQLALFEPKTISITKYYDIKLHSDKVNSIFVFNNKKNEGLGIPLPKGIVKIYQKDKDENLEFIGEDQINHTSIDQNVEISIGNAFDVICKTEVISDTRNGKINEREIQLTIENNKNEDIEIRFKNRYYNGDYSIYPIENFDYKKVDAYSIVVYKNIKSGSLAKLKWRERIVYK